MARHETPLRDAMTLEQDTVFVGAELQIVAQADRRDDHANFLRKCPAHSRHPLEQIAAYAKTAAQQNENAFVHSRRDPYEKIMGWLLPRAHQL